MALLFKFAFEEAMAKKPKEPHFVKAELHPSVVQDQVELTKKSSAPKKASKAKRNKRSNSLYSLEKIDLSAYRNAPIPKVIKRRTQPRYLHLPDDPRDMDRVKKKLIPETRVTCSADAEVSWRPSFQDADKLLAIDLQYGFLTNVSSSSNRVDRELVIGVDLGTSSTKVVISDRSLKQTYAVPFTDGVGVMSYLLPTLLIESNGTYALSGEGESLNDLKLSMMARVHDAVICARVAAFLALVIQYARAWLFQNHSDQYVGSEILWTLALGQPADQLTSSNSKLLFRKLGQVAWSLAETKESLSTKKVLDVWNTWSNSHTDIDDFQCLVMPELAAQIHGYVSSTLFDPRRPNIFLMVDIGAGTVDASIFRVFKDKSGNTNFDLFTNSVEAYGVANLHRSRVNWWQSKIVDSPNGSQCAQELQRIKLATEYRGFFPSSFQDYLRGVEVQFLNGAKNPDEAFFDLVNQQLIGEVLGKAKANRLLGPNDINGMPYFLCGGGARHAFYEQIRPALQRPVGASWINLAPKSLTLPSDLRAEGLSRADYDRLSVAYGLSQLNMGSVNRIAPMEPLATVDHYSKWSDGYTDKDFC
jgi:hypothetical protein